MKKSHRIFSLLLCVLLLSVLLTSCPGREPSPGGPGTRPPISVPGSTPSSGGPGTGHTGAAQIIFEFSEVDSQQHAVAFHSIKCVDTIGHSLGESYFGTPEMDDMLETGWLETENVTELGLIRWAGGPEHKASMNFTLPDGTEGILFKINSISDAMWMDVTVANQPAVKLRVEHYWHSGYVPVTTAEPESVPDAEPLWIEGHYFPEFPSTDRVYALPIRSTFAEDYGAIWQADWRINDSQNDMLALTLVSMQGIINRHGPRVCYDWNDPDGDNRFWIQLLESHIDVVHLDLDNLSSLNFLMRRYSSYFSGAVIYDPEIPDTINLATMIAGLEDRVILAPEQLGLPGLPEFNSITDLRQLAIEQGWQATDEGRLRLYQWVYDNLWGLLEHRIIGILSPGPPTSIGFNPGQPFWPLEMASRDYMIALKAPVVYLSSNNESETELLYHLLKESPSPIPVTGVAASEEVETTRWISRFGDWQAALSWPGMIITVGNLSVFSGVRVELERYQPDIDPDNILATLGDNPVATLYSTDGDAIFYLMQRGFGNSFGWTEVQDQCFGWSINPAFSELAPVLWNYYMESRSPPVSFITGVSGAGYMYPQHMNSYQIDMYLVNTARYLQRTGIRTLFIEGREGDWTEELAAAYYQRLHETGYLGAIISGDPHIRLGFEYVGVPTPAAWPSYAIRNQNEINIADTITSRNPGEEFLDITEQYINPDCDYVEDSDAYGGNTTFVPTVFRYSQSYSMAVNAGAVNLYPGDYEVKFRMKVSNNSSNLPVAGIYVGEKPTDWRTIVYQSITPSDFTQSGEYQDFILTFHLDSLATQLYFRVDYQEDVADLYVDTIDCTRIGGAAMPVFAVIMITLMLNPEEFEFQARAPERFIEEFEGNGGIVLTPDEFMAVLNPEFMLEFASTILNAGDAAIGTARQQLENGEYLDSLLTIRAALREYLNIP